MDEYEKTVLRRKRPLIVQLLPFTIEMQKKLKQFDLLDDSMLQDILPEQTEKGQMSRFLEQLMRKNPGKKAFRRLQDLLRAEDYSWVADEMEVDLIAEKGELLIEPYVEKEAAMIVHKWFGTSKLIPEQSKSEIAYIVALRYQAAKEALMSQLSTITAQRDEAKDFRSQEEEKLKILTEKIKTFMKIQKIKVNEFVRQESAADAVREDGRSNRDRIRELEENIDAILDVLARMNLESEKMNDERAKAYKVLGMQKGAVALDLAIRHALLNASEDIKRSQRQADVTEEMATQLDSQLRNTQMVSEREVQAREKQISYLEKQLRASKEKNQDLEDELARLRRLLAEREHELEKAKRDMIVLKKTRHLGYINPNWVDLVSTEDGTIDSALVPVDDIHQVNQEKKKEPKPTPARKEKAPVTGKAVQPAGRKQDSGKGPKVNKK